ncbi:MAG: hypothetical protein ACLFSI_02640 [Halorhodospira sp.]
MSDRPNVDELPEAPQRTDPQSDYSKIADKFFAALDGFRRQLIDLADWMVGRVDDADSAASTAESARDTAKEHRDDAEQYRDTAVASKDTAVEKADAAVSSESAAADSADAAATSESNAAASEQAADEHRADAKHWANEAEEHAKAATEDVIQDDYVQNTSTWSSRKTMAMILALGD